MFEKIREQRRTLVFFATTYIVFGSAFFYLLFLTPGLDFVQAESNGKVQIFLFNDSSHVIHSVDVETDSGKKVAFVERLLPREKVPLSVGKTTGMVKLVARAPYHAAVKKSFTLVGAGNNAKEVNLKYEITLPNIVFVDMNFAVEIEVCNLGEALESISIGEKHSKKFFAGQSVVETISLGKSECKKIPFSFSPRVAGKTKIYFNVKTLSYTKQIEKEITIKE